ncbi:MAG: aminotransferase class I/II-fold pyridoxal phosphate-dependent enzyme [Candidatus Bathyarchaeota archaeon]|nr:MAG: aminotransferase class I/II-fold pyridoxal phosphate-dependent enzyme [Candidatus Bathyarchaeota archaeon]
MNPQHTATKRVSAIKYAIRDVVKFAKDLEAKGNAITYLNIGDPVKFDFDTPKHLKSAVCKAVKEGENWYGASEGIPELREAICRKEKRSNGIDLVPEDIVVTAGVSEGILLTMAALIERGDELLVPGPTYPPYTSYSKFFGGNPISYRTIEEEGWQPDIADIESKISTKTKGIVLINPNNPCGAVYDPKTVAEITELADQNDLIVLSDEIYDRIVYEEQFSSTARVAKDSSIIGLNGFSKVYLATGWRVGYLYFHDLDGKLDEIKEGVKKQARIRLCANTPIQKAAIVALNGPQEHIQQMVTKLRKRRDYAWKRLNQIEGITCTKPKGAFYLFPKVHGVGQQWKTDLEFVLEVLRETGVLFVHGSGFCETYGARHFRSVFLPSIKTLAHAFDLLEQFMIAKKS